MIPFVFDRQKLLEQEFDVLGGTPDEFSHVVNADTVKFSKVIKESGIRIN